MKEKNGLKTRAYSTAPFSLEITYLPQDRRGLSSFHQENSGADSRSAFSPSAETLGLAESLEESLRQMDQALAKAIPARALRFNHRSITGWISGRKEDSQVQFESTLERDFAYLAFFDSRVIDLFAQPLTLTYVDSVDKTRTYTPDFEVTYRDSLNQERKSIIEIKYQEELDNNPGLYDERFAAMADWCRNNDATFHLITDRDIRTTRIDNVKALYPFRMANDDDGPGTAQLQYFLSEQGPMSIGATLDAMANSKDERARMQHNIWWLIASGWLWIDLNEPITFDTVIFSKPTHINGGLFFNTTEE